VYERSANGECGGRKERDDDATGRAEVNEIRRRKKAVKGGLQERVRLEGYGMEAEKRR